MNKNDLIRFRCTNEERTLIQAAAEAEKRSLSDYIRLTVTEAAKEKLKKGDAKYGKLSNNK